MKIKNLIFLAGMAGLCACVKGTHTQKAYDFAPLDSIISSWMDKGYYPGGAVCVMKDDSVLFRKDYGGFTDSTQVYVASAGKWVAAAVVAAVVDMTALDWDDPVEKWLPEFRGDAKGGYSVAEAAFAYVGYPAVSS